MPVPTKNRAKSRSKRRPQDRWVDGLLRSVVGALHGARRAWNAEAAVRREPRARGGSRRDRRVEFDTYALARWRMPDGGEELRWHCVTDERRRMA